MKKDSRKDTNDRIANPLSGKKSYTPDFKKEKVEKPLKGFRKPKPEKK